MKYTFFVYFFIFTLLLQGFSQHTADAQTFDAHASSFEQLYQLAIKQNHDVKVLQETLKVTQEDIGIAATIPNPSLNTYWGWGRQTSVLGNPNQVGLTQTFELGPKRKLRTLIAKTILEKEKTGLQQALWLLRSNLRLAYLEYLATVSQTAQLEKQFVSVNQLIRIAEVRVKAGSSPEADLLQARLVRSQLFPQRIQLEGQLAQNRLKLAYFVGEEDPSRLPLSAGSLALLEHIPQWKSFLPQAKEEALILSLQNEGLTQRQELKVALKQVDASRLQLKSEKIKRIPDAQVGGGVLFVNTLSPLSTSNPTANEKGTFLGGYVTLNVPLPVFDNQEEEIGKAKAQLSTDEKSVEALTFSIKNSIQQAITGIATQQRVLDNYRENLLPQSQEVLRLADLGYRYGKTGLANVILARQACQAIQLDYLLNLGLAWQAWALLEQQTGLPLEGLLLKLPWEQPTVDFTHLRV